MSVYVDDSYPVSLITLPYLKQCMGILSDNSAGILFWLVLFSYRLREDIRKWGLQYPFYGQATFCYHESVGRSNIRAMQIDDMQILLNER